MVVSFFGFDHLELGRGIVTEEFSRHFGVGFALSRVRFLTHLSHYYSQLARFAGLCMGPAWSWVFRASPSVSLSDLGPASFPVKAVFALSLALRKVGGAGIRAVL